MIIINIYLRLPGQVHFEKADFKMTATKYNYEDKSTNAIRKHIEKADLR